MAPTATGAAASSSAGPSTSAVAAAPDPAEMPGSLEEAQQRYQQTKKALRAGLAQKRQIDKSLTDLESQIYLYEASYLASTAASGGNIVKGFDSYLKNTSSQSAAAAAAAKGIPIEVPLEDRIFSLSSATYQKSLELKKAEELAAEAGKEDKKEKEKEKDKDKDKSSGSGSGSGSSKKDKDKDKDKDDTPSKPEKEAKKSKKDRNASEDRDRRSGTPLARDKDSASSAVSTPGGKAGKTTSTGLISKLKRKAEASGGSSAGTPGGKNSNKRKKEDD